MLLGIAFLLATSVIACGKPTAVTHISAEPEELSFAARAGDNTLSEPLEIRSSAIDEPVTWEAKDDTLWLEVKPSRGTFDCGVSKATVWVDTSGMGVGVYSTSISIFVPEADNSPLTIPVELCVETPEDPAVVAAREFWESSRYKRYWDLNASTDVIKAIRSYEFPPPGETRSTSQEVEIKNVEFKYNPAIHERPIAMVHCIITWHRTYFDEQERYWLETWTGDWDVILEVEPEPYHVDHNEWKVIDYYTHISE